MVLFSKKIFLLAIIMLGILCPNFTNAQLSFKVTVSPGTIGKNETVELKLMVDNARQVEEITPPSFKDFIIVGGPNQESGMESINGVTRQYIGLTYILKPKGKGKFTFEPAIAKADGKTVKSNRVSLTVTNENQSANNSNNAPQGGFLEPAFRSADRDYVLKKGENILDKIDKNIFIKVDADKTTCYVGQPIVVTYKLYTRLKSESSIIKNPSFNGFSVIDLMPPGNTYYSTEKINGREFNVYTLRKTQLYALQSGSIELESAEVENNIHFIKEEYLSRQMNGFDDLFRDFTQTNVPPEGMHDEKVTLRSKPVFITVKPLPERENSSGAFKGAVGKFNLQSAIEKTNFTTDDAGKLSVVITGEGNMTMVIAPDVKWPSGIESFDPKANEQLNKYSVPVSGTKVFEYAFTVAKPGSYTLPPIKFCYFDPAQNSYVTDSTKPVSIKITQGSKKQEIVTDPNKTNSGANAFFNILFTNRWLIILPLVIFMITGIFLWLKKDKKKDILTEKKKMAASENLLFEPVAVINFKPLLLTEEKLIQQDHRQFFETLNKEFRQFLADKLGVHVETINRKIIAEEADKKGVPIYICMQIQTLLDDIELQLYTPFSNPEKMQEFYNTADEIVHSLNATRR
ncbi:MAG: BatD family protein [Ferruginibacter sp.]